MKMYYSIQTLFFSTVFFSSLLAHDHVHDYIQIECAIVAIGQKEATNHGKEHVSHPHIPGPRGSRVPAGMATSTNWSGYVAANNLNHPTKNSVSAVSGSWIVPTITSTGHNDYSAFWVGIDGYSSPTVEQIGTEHDWINGVQQNYAWFEMYPGGSYLISGFPLHPGDVISASVTYIGSNTFVLTLMNDTKKVSYTIPTSYTKSSTALRESAEWIIEAPYLNGILPLSDFVTGYMWGCLATISGHTDVIKSSKWQNIGIEMVTNNGTPKAIPSGLLPDNGSFFVTWNHE